jgi:hypothetical protein
VHVNLASPGSTSPPVIPRTGDFTPRTRTSTVHRRGHAGQTRDPDTCTRLLNARSKIHGHDPSARRSLLARCEESQQSIADEHRRFLWRPLSAVHAQHSETGLNQTVRRLVVEMNFGMATTGRELEAVMWSAFRQSSEMMSGSASRMTARSGRSISALSCHRKARSMPSKRCITRPEGM